MKKVSRLFMVFLGFIFFCFLNSCTLVIPTIPSDVETKLEQKGYDVEMFAGSDAQIATGYTGFFKKNYEKAIDVVIGTYEEGDYGCIFIVWFQNKEIAEQANKEFYEYLEEHPDTNHLESRIYENIIYIGNEKGIFDFEY